MLAAAKLRWNSTDFQRNGRTGQKQDGVDVFGRDDNNCQIGVQCKNSVGGISLDVVKDEVAMAEAFQPPLDWLYIATTAKRDTSLQRDVRLLSDARLLAGKFRVGILFWDEIWQDLATDDAVFFAHYPQFRVKVDEGRAHDRVLYEQLTTLLRSDGIIGFLDKNNMAGFSFLNADFGPLLEFLDKWKAPEREFISPKLDTIRKALLEKAEAYVMLLSTETFPTHSLGRNTVPPEWEHEQSVRFWRVVKEFHTLAGEIVALHADLVRTGKAELIG